MIVIGFTGPAGAGKDTAGQMLAEYLRKRKKDVRVQAWADKLKISAARALGERGSDEHLIAFCDRLKVEGLIQVSFTNPGNRDGARRTELVPFSGRQFLEWLGTEGGRDVHGENVWIDLALPAPHQLGGLVAMSGWLARMPDVVIDTSTRFPNEMERIREWDGKIIRIERDEYRAPEDGHVSRAGIPAAECDAVIINDGTLEDLRAAVVAVYNGLTDQHLPTRRKLRASTMAPHNAGCA